MAMLIYTEEPHFSENALVHHRFLYIYLQYLNEMKCHHLQIEMSCRYKRGIVITYKL